MYRLGCALCVLLCVTVFGHEVQKREDNAEVLIDEFIYETVQDLKKNHEEQISIPDIDETFEKKVLFVKVKGELTGTGGWIKDLTTLKRTAPSQLVEKDDTIAVGVTLGLNDLEFGFKEYRAEVYHFGIHGTMHVSVEQNSVYVHMTMKFDDKGGCKTTLDKVEIQKLDGYHADMTGLGRNANFIYSFVATFLANKYHQHIESSLSNKLTPVISAALAKNDICKQFPH
uniref:Secreted venom protein family 5 protein n=1 Tax=Pristhesancus plagipennis TaxID=1955184 RepID=A0A2K8JML1_PRIPG|nr:secreted venom protein family 5 protein [Pristhesancus plagipennis]